MFVYNFVKLKLYIPPQLFGPPQFWPRPPPIPRPPLRPLAADAATSLLTAFLTSNLVPDTSWLLITTINR